MVVVFSVPQPATQEAAWEKKCIKSKRKANLSKLAARSVLLFTAMAVADDGMDDFCPRTLLPQEKMVDLQPRCEAQICASEILVAALEKSVSSHPPLTPPIERAAGSEAATHHSETRQRWSTAGLASMGGSSASADELLLLQGGTHDPRKTGITLQALTFGFRADLGRRLDATIAVVSHTEPDGEKVLELGQAYLRATELLPGMSVMAGQFFQDFGAENKRHAAEWDFADVPFLITRFFGSDKLRTQGIQIAWDVPLSWSSTIYAGANNPQGETAVSFLYNEGENVGGHLLQARGVGGFGDLLYLLKWSHVLSSGSDGRVGLGVSALFGPNASGYSTNTQIYGMNFQWTRYFTRQPLFDWRTELMYRRYEAGDESNPDHETFIDFGAFTQFLLYFRNNWTAGLRAEFSDSNIDSDNDPLRSQRRRFAINLSHPISPDAWWRLQYNRDQADYLRDEFANSLWLQFGFKTGGDDEH